MDKKGQKLHGDNTEFENYWIWSTNEGSELELLPNYIHMHSGDSYTLIAIPLRNQDNVLGLLVLEFSEVIPYNQTAREEIELLRDSFSQIIWLNDITKGREKSTRVALKGLEEHVGQMFSAVRATLFFAYACKADEPVVTAIRDVLKRFEAYFELRDWGAINQTGEINSQIIREISRCRYGICYFSEKMENFEKVDIKSNQLKIYKDNSNVLIEAGMLQALKGGQDGGKRNWIPIREDEKVTTPAPFDFIGQRTIMVPRDDDGSFNVTEFVKKLEETLSELLDIKSDDDVDN